MPLLKRKPVHHFPLPSLGVVLQPPHSFAAAYADASSPDPGPSTGKGKGKKPRASSPTGGSAHERDASDGAPLGWTPLDGATDEEQLERLSRVFREDFGTTHSTARGKVRSHLKQVDRAMLAGLVADDGRGDYGVKDEPGVGVEGTNGDKKGEEWKIWDRECFYVPETGEIFTDYESFCNRRAFLEQPNFQCEISSKSSLSYTAALQSERRETRQLHSRFPDQLKRAVLIAVQFQVEGKLDTLADKVFERFVNRFFDNEKIFVDVEGDKYLARIVRTFPPKNLASKTAKVQLKPGTAPDAMHPLASDLGLETDEVDSKDDPMAYFYNVRLITGDVDEDGPQEDAPTSGGNGNGIGAGDGDGNGHGGADGEEEGDEKWEGSVMEVKADKLSRDRLNFSRSMLRRFIRDCVTRDAAVYSPWLLKPNIAARYGIPSEMPDYLRQRMERFRVGQMEKRKRERDERLGIASKDDEAEDVSVVDIKPDVVDGEGQPKKKRKKAEKKDKSKEEEERLRVEEERRRKRFTKYTLDDLCVEYKPDKDGAAGRIGLRPAPNTNLPFGDQFELFLATWNFLNTAGIPIKLSPFAMDDFETALYHSDPLTPPLLLTEIHACLINSLVADLAAGHEPVYPLRHVVDKEKDDAMSESDYWEGLKGATTETLRPVAQSFAETWKAAELPSSNGRKGWHEALIGVLWERATLATLPSYLDNILHLTWEIKPAPTRPTWSTAPAPKGPGAGLIPSRPERRFSSLHHVHKLEILAWLVELVAQTAVVREWIEDSAARLTEVRKEQLDVKREAKRVRAELEALEPKEEVKQITEEAEEGEAGGEVASTFSEPAPNGVPSEQDEGDELESSRASSPMSEIDSEQHTTHHSAAARRAAMAAAAASREAAEAAKRLAQRQSAAAAKEKRLETKALATEKKKLVEDDAALERRTRELDCEFRAAYYALRAAPLGLDRYGNKVWWFDGMGSAPLYADNGRIAPGSGGRVFMQGVEETQGEVMRRQGVGALAAFWSAGIDKSATATATGAAAEAERARAEEKDKRDAEVYLSEEVVRERRIREEGSGRLEPGQWGVYDSVESLDAFMSYLSPKGIRECALLKMLNHWKTEITAGTRRRRALLGLDEEVFGEAAPGGVGGGGAGAAGAEGGGAGAAGRGIRTRKAVEGEGGVGWKNKRAV